MFIKISEMFIKNVFVSHLKTIILKNPGENPTKPEYPPQSPIYIYLNIYIGVEGFGVLQGLYNHNACVCVREVSGFLRVSESFCIKVCDLFSSVGQYLSRFCYVLCI